MLGEYFKRQKLSVVTALLLALLWHPCQAQNIDPSRWVTWYCWLGQDSHYSIHCLDFGDDGTIETGALFDAERLRRDPLPGVAAPTLARLASMDPATYGGRLLLIPLYTYPFNMERVTLLARSVLCGHDPRCRVQFETAP